MSKSLFEVELHRIDLPGGDYIEISKYETEADHRRLLAALGKASKPKAGSPSDFDFELDLPATRMVTLENRIKGWSLKDGAGNPVPIQPSTIASLPRRVTDLVMAAIVELEDEIPLVQIEIG